MIDAKKLLFLFCLSLAGLAGAQETEEQKEDENNLVPNPGFEKLMEDEDLRRYDEFGITEGWYDPTDAHSELFASETRSRYVKIPENMYGNEMPFEGNNYAGIHAFSYRNREPRTYLGVELKRKMNDNALYCIKYRASLAERSLYASNNLGAALSSKQINKKGETSIILDDALLSDKNEVVKIREGWWEFCKRYNAKGGEKYLVIGNFKDDERTAYETMDLPAEYAEEGSEAAAYYYIDGVEIREIQPNENCGCSNTKIPDSKIIFSGTIQLDDDISAEEKVEAIDAYFYQYKDNLVSAAERTVDRIIALMQENPDLRVEITGHTDNEEAELSKRENSLIGLGMQRAENTRDYMVDQGVDAGRITISSKENKDPVSTMKTPLSLAKNRRVEFSVAK
jgi:outer membrane protein OmpA-like peptidoglycan-associated protein